MALDYSRCRALLKDFNFRSLFREELGWDRYASTLDVATEDQTFTLTGFAEKHGLIVFTCTPQSNGTVPNYGTRRKIEARVAKSVFEHIIIYTDAANTTQIWQWVRREPGKPAACREHTYNIAQPGDALIQKLETIVFSLEEEESLTTVAVAGRVRVAFDVERITRRFYDRFKTEHAQFLKFIQGIPDEEMKRWYASVMINRLMFIYFIQKKGFLNNDRDYLRTKLQESKRRGKDLYYSGFLSPLFFKGFAEKDRSGATEQLLGKVPYLNGGLFLKHQIEEQHGKTIEIRDAAFQKVFDFFDSYQWHLDERPLRRDNEINPDVLGYIFEKYINQKQMGAYYTKEDITEYISKNTIIPFLFERAHEKCKIAFEGDHSIWQLLQGDPDRYIYKAVRHGVTWDIHSDKPLESPHELPTEIAKGLDSSRPDLIERRKVWNKQASPEFALPTEIWREVIARRNRYEEIRAKLVAGEVRDINDLITYNFDIRQFAQDVIENSEGPDLLNAFWYATEKVTVLDPACGSGAFLFAALNILEPLYEACLDRMDAFLEEWGEQGRRLHPNYYKLFNGIRTRLEQHPNRRHFTLKSIIINNLFGVDIMEEATEICKLRLFLKLVAQVERDEQIEPLPDIDFNIRAGNTLVGYATYDEVKRAVSAKLDFEDAMGRIEEKAQDVDRLFALFRQQQTELGGEVTADDKKELRKRLKVLEDELNEHLSNEYGVKSVRSTQYSTWLHSHKPFHWFVEFHPIIMGGGFDTILSNPPYVEVPKNLNRTLLRHTFRTALERWSRDEDLYTFFVERSLVLLKKTGQFGMILPLSLSFSTKAPFVVLRKVLSKEPGLWHWLHFDRIPSALFGNEVRTRCTISLLSRSTHISSISTTTTPLMRWNAEYRDHLFRTMNLSKVDVDITAGIPKISSEIQARALKSLFEANTPLGLDLTRSISFETLASVAPDFPQPCLYVGGTAYNWFPAWRDIPSTTNLRGQPSLPARTAGFRFADEDSANIAFALLCSSLGYWWWAVASDGFNLKKWLLNRFPLSISSIPRTKRPELAKLGARLRTRLKQAYVYKDNKGQIGNYYLPACEKETASIDVLLASAIPSLSEEFFSDISNFNGCFSRAEDEDAVDE
jgi:hypothetical protein